MEDVMLQRLGLIVENMKIISQEAQPFTKAVPDSELERVELIILKLETLVNRFSSELNDYFRTSQDPSADDISEYSAVQLQCEEIIVEIKYRIKNRSCNKEVTTQDNLSTSTSKLPKLSLPTFNGNVLDWHQFWDQFSSNIHHRNIPDVDKLLYLKASLTGDARRVIDGLDATHKNYQIAISTLTERFGKEIQVVDAHYSALSKIRAANEDVADCRRALNEIERHLRVLTSLGENVNHNHLRFLIIEKFPENLIYEMKMKIKNDSIEEMRTKLELIVSAREEANRISLGTASIKKESYTIETLHTRDWMQHNRRDTKPPNDNTTRSQQRDTTNSRPWVYKVGNNETSRKRPYQDRRDFNSRLYEGNKRKKLNECVFCKGSHYNDQCQEAKTVTQRKSRLSQRCFNCFRSGHTTKYCQIRVICYHCNGLHNRALCPVKFPDKAEPPVAKGADISTTLHTSTRGFTVLQTAVAEIKKHGETTRGLKCRILMDSGSQRSYVTQEVAKHLNLPTEEDNLLSVFTFGSKTPQELQSPMVKLEIETRSNERKTIYANVVPMISQGIPYPHKELSNWKDKTVLADDGSLSDEVNLLIGNDYYYTLMSTEKIKIKEDLFLVNSDLGWILSGKTDSKPVEELSVITYFQSGIDLRLNEPDPPLDNVNIKFLWELEAIGITDSPKTSREEEAIKHFNDTTEYINNRYSVRWPWNEYPPNLPSNYGLALGRLVNLLKRLDNETLTTYDKTIKEQVEKGIIEVVPQPTTARVEHPIHYLPHHCVSQPGKTIRIVYDASSKTKNGKSLNENLYCGPVMLEDLTRILLRFRLHRVALSADVEKAFLQVALQENDRDVTRFLWIKNISKAATEDNLIELRFCRVPFGVISSPFLLNATIHHHLSKAQDQTVKQVIKDIYVDNLLTGTNTVHEARKLYKTIKGEFRNISMNLREWSSNSKEFMENTQDTCKEKDVKILGLNWNTERDTLQLRYKIQNNANTKRGVLKTVAAAYDPCGYGVPLIVPAKLFLQDLWKQKVKWDETLSKEMTDKWSDMYRQINMITEISLPRRYIQEAQKEDYQLHCFTDASMKVYAAVVYIVNGNERGFIIGKARLVPLKEQQSLQIPRLELLGVLIGSRLINYVTTSLHIKIKEQYIWTDSQIVIDWYNSDKLLAPFVTRRIEEIKRNKNLIIRYVPSELNTADIATRPIESIESIKNWINGPDFITQKPETWPKNHYTSFSLLAGEDLPNTHTEKTEVINQIETTRQETAGNCNNIKVQIKTKMQKIKELQRIHFPEESKGKETNLSRNLRLFPDIEGIIRCKGRMENTEWSFDKKYPILIPGNCEFTNNIIKQTHDTNYHVGANHTLSIIRQNYWIPNGKKHVTEILKKCPRCIKHGGGPFKLPPTPALPPERVNYSSPFTFTGIDYLGPVQTDNDNSTNKRWICLFTCLAVRAIHLEVVQDLTAEEGLRALRRMVATRGMPAVITSDNALYFKLISEILAQPYCVKNEIRWKFIPALTPWFGGFYERLVGLVKHCMKRSLQKQLLKDTELNTIIKEIEAVLNTRPLICVDSELEHILTPSDFLTAGNCITMDTAEDELPVQGTITKRELIQGWKRARITLEEFKTMFSNRYLASLRERYHHSHKEPRVTSNLTPKVGQMVQMKGESKNRESWQVGKLTELVKSADGLYRVGKVKIGNVEYTRSLAHLYPLEIEEEEEVTYPRNVIYHKQEPNSSVTNQLETNNTPETPQRQQPPNRCPSPLNQQSNSEEIMQIDSCAIDPSVESIEDDETPYENLELDDFEDFSENPRPKRDAAIKALTKIREWTRNLTTIL